MNLEKRVDKNLGMEIPRDVKKFRKQQKLLIYGWPKKSHISDFKTKRSGHVMLTVPTDRVGGSSKNWRGRFHLLEVKDSKTGGTLNLPKSGRAPTSPAPH